ncbi:MAG TPA: cytochrome P450 [Candidatus Sulfopaludibacter sp.]|jgi:cytochrome P450|nr:cytochrome P450 [Candidatus Sulfopaludibacter sp.]
MSSAASPVRAGNTNYLELFDTAGDERKFPLVRQWMNSEPLSFFAQLREERPVLTTPAATLVARFADVTDILNQPKIFTVALYQPKMSDYLMAHDDDALHYREKSIMQGFLNRDDIPAVRAMVAQISAGILANAGGAIEIVNSYCRMTPACLVQQYFGLDGVDSASLIEWSYWNQYDAFHNQPFSEVSDEMRTHISSKHEEVTAKLGAYLKKLILRKLIEVKAEAVATLPLTLEHDIVELVRGKPAYELKDDIVSRMLRTSYPEAMEFDLQRVGINAGGLLVGAIETTSQAVAQVIQFLLDRPHLLSAAREAARLPDPQSFDGMVWEALRFAPIGPFLFRKASQDCVVGAGTPHETAIPAGTIVLALAQSAMFDRAAFDRPDEFMGGRNWYRYFHFGFGSHECLGKYVGMVMIPEMVRQVMLLPQLQAGGPIDYQAGPFPERYELAWRAQ